MKVLTLEGLLDAGMQKGVAPLALGDPPPPRFVAAVSTATSHSNVPANLEDVLLALTGRNVRITVEDLDRPDPAAVAPDSLALVAEALALAGKASRLAAHVRRDGPRNHHPDPADYDELAGMVRRLVGALTAARDVEMLLWAALFGPLEWNADADGIEFETGDGNDTIRVPNTAAGMPDFAHAGWTVLRDLLARRRDAERAA